jgi:sensor c-di-GMP phosphodiesterase-like protein
LQLAWVSNDAVVVQPIITLVITPARSLGLEILAEGVESHGQHEFLKYTVSQSYRMRCGVKANS